MITISTRDYTTEQLKDLAYGLSMAHDKICKRYECEYDLICNRECEYNLICNRECKGYVLCNDIFNTWRYLYVRIKEREALELH